MNFGVKINSFTDLHAWQKAHVLVLDIYQVTKKFPADERYGLTDQVRRSAVSVSSNISEGFSRQSDKEKKQFYFQALGSLTELQNQLLIARDVSYITNKEFRRLADLSVEVSKLIRSLMKFSYSKF